MKQRHGQQPPVATTTALVVLLASTCPNACGGEVEGGGTGGGAGAGTGTGTATGTGTGTGTGAGTTTSADTCPFLVCDEVDIGETLVATVASDGTTLTVRVAEQPDATCSSVDYRQWQAPPIVDVSAALGTLASVDLDGTTVVITITLAPDATDGTVTLAGEVIGETFPVVCSVEREFTVTWSSGGEPEIAAADSVRPPALRHRPNVRLALAETLGTRATLEVTGVPADAGVEFAVTDGQVRQHGARALWSLPERPGLYQIEVVVRQGLAVATDTLVVEVRPAVEARRG